ncbi:ABC transporter permease [Campylobacter geochelonis]|uniref:Acyl-[acyl-carrier-protein]--UDP-N-acetylglucosamine O-acyltransferase n=1 Tax=Campylobacter geochelonis TaxID=1780362 RepID=A0A128EI10_9BACT|nr:FtsX-like permease family protein [Campylobacter geochelonis]QKF70874.1 ABC transporter, permease protein, FtsX/LolE family [Campylobacter geochelonis]CZE47968.1 acyl-[acyl-carrier-protein]--UDP-N-acetylglucosamine O-acyltransferase [Campylobacter geochelonis]CZE48869.1 acyl-[acyl-carrier-protein]--UDP-N-acetylglucosamine O-acyltransferase [Campylobacter geochelonis]CZE51368.1 acyl-[acyl-carrier-protein]--UDP-N-acetylglucosamine O-acyltransferase [Campylobacter geochelonis]
MNNLFEYTLASIIRHGYKNLVIITIFGFLVWLLSSVLFITNSLNYEYKTISKEFPDILIQENYGGKSYLLKADVLDKFWQIPGVSSIEGRVWGQYYFETKKIYLSIFGVKSFVDYYEKTIKDIAQTFPENKTPPLMITSKSVYELLKNDIKMYGSVPFFTPDNNLISVKAGGVLKFDNSLEDNDIILLDESVARKILGIKDGYFTDAMMRIANPNEVDFIADKIHIANPTLKLTTKSQMLKNYQFLYDYKSGWFLMILITAFVTFAIILYDKASGLRSEEKKEIGILKALGWEISHIINYKLMEALLLSLFAFVIGVAMAIFFVYVLEAPGLKYVFSGYSSLKQPFELPFVLDFKSLMMIFFATIPIYVAVCIIPSWKIAVADAGEVIR